MSEIKKIINTIRYMTFRQWKYRVYYTIRNKIVKRHLCNPPNNIEVRQLPLNYKNDIRKKDAIETANKLLNNTFVTISGIEKSFENEIDWNLKDEGYRLVCFKLNSFGYLLDLSDAYKITDDELYINKGFDLIENWWKDNNSLIKGDKWNPYVVAARLMNWIGFCSEYCDITDRSITRYANWIYQQTMELKRSVEYQLGANHLLSEGKTLLICGAFLKRQKLYKYGKSILVNEYKKQFYVDGGHYERSISYHIESLQQYFESIAVMTELNDNDAIKFTHMIKPAYQYLNGMVASNGEYPLFNDSAKDYPFQNAVEFLATSILLYDTPAPNVQYGDYFTRWKYIEFSKKKIQWDEKVFFPETGYLHHKLDVFDKRYSLFFDAGNGGPDSNMGHTHADALSILLSGPDKDILVDTGVFTYKPGEGRNTCRSTKAHNTIEIDEKNSSEIWSAFRVAKRGHTKVLSYHHVDDILSICAIHDGYCKCLSTPVIHERTVSVSGGNIEITDRLVCESMHKAISRFHIGEYCIIKMNGDRECLIDDHISITCSRPFRIVECEVAAYFGIKKQAKCLEIPFIILNETLVKMTICIHNLEEIENG